MRVELPWLFYTIKTLPFTFIQSIFEVRDRFWIYGNQAVANLKQHVASSGSDASKSFFAQFLDPKKKEQELTDVQISSEAANMIIAGSDTTAVTLTYLVWAVCHPKYRHVRKKLMEEIESVNVDARAADLLELKYLRNVIQEIMRLYGAASGSLPRVPPLGGAVVGGYEVPEWATVSVQNFSTARLEEVYSNALR